MSASGERLRLIIKASDPVVTYRDGVWWVCRSWLTTVLVDRATMEALRSHARLEGYPLGAVTPYIEDRLRQLAEPAVVRRLPRPQRPPDKPKLQPRGSWRRGPGRPKTSSWRKRRAKQEESEE